MLAYKIVHQRVVCDARARAQALQIPLSLTKDTYIWMEICMTRFILYTYICILKWIQYQRSAHKAVTTHTYTGKPVDYQEITFCNFKQSSSVFTSYNNHIQNLYFVYVHL